MQRTLTDLRSLAAAADQAAGTDAALDLWRKTLSMAQRDPRLAQELGVPYILGYAHYELVGIEPGAEEASTRFLLLALEQDASDVFAKLYLGHLAFDAGRYAAALEWFETIPPHSFSARGQAWRDLKTQELRICCLARLGRTASLVREFEAYLLIATECEEADVLTVFELPELLAALAQGSVSGAAS